MQVVRANANKLFLFKSFLAFDLESHSGEPLKDFRDAFVVSIKGKQGSLAAFEQFFPQNNSKRCESVDRSTRFVPRNVLG